MIGVRLEMFNKIINIIYVGLLIATYTLTNVFICSIVSQSILNYLIIIGYNKFISLLISLAFAIIIYTYIIFNYKIKEKIKKNTVLKGTIKK